MSKVFKYCPKGSFIQHVIDFKYSLHNPLCQCWLSLHCMSSENFGKNQCARALCSKISVVVTLYAIGHQILKLIYIQVLYSLQQHLETSDICTPLVPVIIAKLTTLKEIHDYFESPCIWCYMDCMWQLLNIVYVYRMSILTFKRLGQLWYGKISCKAVSVAPCVPKPTSWSESLVKYYIPFIHH